MQIARSLFVAACIFVSCNALAQSRFSYGADGAEVIDSKTGLIWRRCSVGQTWSGGTCTGTASTFTQEGALVHAQSQAGWRLPNVKELSSIVNRTKDRPTIDDTAFPATVSSWYWSSSPYAYNVIAAWYVDFMVGGTGTSYRGGADFYVRLVRQ